MPRRLLIGAATIIVCAVAIVAVTMSLSAPAGSVTPGSSDQQDNAADVPAMPESDLSSLIVRLGHAVRTEALSPGRGSSGAGSPDSKEARLDPEWDALPRSKVGARDAMDSWRDPGRAFRSTILNPGDTHIPRELRMALTESMRSAASIIAEMESYRDKVRVSEITSFVSDNTGRFELQKGEWGEAYRLLGLAPSVDCVLFADAAGKRYMVPPHALSRTHEVSEALTLAEEVLRMRMLDFFEHVNALDSRSAELLRGLWQDGGVDSLRNLVRLHPEQAAELLRLLGR